MTTRHRFTDLTLDGSVPARRVEWGGDPLRVITDTVYPTGSYLLGYYSAIDDENHTDFRTRMLRGDIIIGDLVRYWWRRELSGVNGVTAGPHTGWGKIVFTGGLNQLVEAANPWSSHVTDNDIAELGSLQLVRAYAKMNAPDIAGGEYLGEFTKTLALLKNPFAGIWKLSNKMVDRYSYLAKKTRSVKGMSRRLRAQQKAQAQAWLEARYGMLPLVYDAQVLLERAHQLRQKIGWLRRVARAGTVREFTKTTDFVRKPYFVGSSQLLATGRCTVNDKIRASAGVIYRLDTDERFYTRGSAFFGTRASDMPKTAWDLLPFSFVADWATNVGDWLQAVTPAPGITPLGNWTTTVHERSIKFDPGVSEYKYGTLYDPGTHAGSTFTSFTMRRVRNASLPPTPSVTDIHLSLTRSLDATALLVKPVHALLRKFSAR